MLDPVALGKNLASLREKADMSPKQLAHKLHVDPDDIAHWESGKTYPDTLLLPDLANVFKVSIDTLLGLQTIPEEEGEVYTLDLEDNMPLIDKSADYAFTLTQNNKVVFYGSPNRFGQLTIQLNGNCRDFYTNCSTVIHGDVQGNAHFSSDAPVYIDGSIQGDVTALFELTIYGDVSGQVDCGRVHIYGNASGTVSCSECVAGTITGNVDSTICRVSGNINCENLSCGSLECAHIECGSLQINGPVTGKIDLFDGILYDT